MGHVDKPPFTVREPVGPKAAAQPRRFGSVPSSFSNPPDANSSPICCDQIAAPRVLRQLAFMRQGRPVPHREARETWVSNSAGNAFDRKNVTTAGDLESPRTIPTGKAR